MTKRDDESGINATGDIEDGMTTAERRRRRRGRGGLRVPSDNVPRRTPPVVAPVPEDPSLAMSIAYSFTTDGSEPVPRVAASDVPSFLDPQAPDSMSTVIDPPSSPVESADFEMKTREMSAVDLDALGLAEHPAPVSAGPAPSPGLMGATLPASPAGGPSPGIMDASELQARIRGQVKPRSATDPTLDTNPALEASPLQLPPTMVKTQPMPTMRASTAPIISEPATRQMRAATDPGTPPTPAPQPRERLRTMALSDDDLLEVREAAARALTANPMVPAPTKPTNATQPLSALDIEANDKPEPISVSDIDINELADRADSSGEFDVDIDEQEPLKPVPQAASVTPPPAVPSADRRSRPPSVPPHGPPRAAPPSTTAQAAGTAPHGAHAPPPPPPAHKAPPAPPPKAKANVAAVTPIAKPEAKTPRGKPWFVDLFDEDYLRTLPFLTPQATQSEAEFVIDALGLQPGAQVLDVGCGYGRHAMELAARGFHVVGLSTLR